MRNLQLYLVHLLKLHGILVIKKVSEFKAQNRTLIGYLKFKLKGLFYIIILFNQLDNI